MRDLRVVRSARKHKVGKAHMLAAMRNAGTPTLLAGDRLLYVGLDDRGIELEIIAVPDDQSPAGLTIIHAMPTALRRRGR